MARARQQQEQQLGRLRQSSSSGSFKFTEPRCFQLHYRFKGQRDMPGPGEYRVEMDIQPRVATSAQGKNPYDLMSYEKRLSFDAHGEMYKRLNNGVPGPAALPTSWDKGKTFNLNTAVFK